MKRLINPILILIISIILSASSGCTKIDVPIHEKDTTKLKLSAKKPTILDTEPVIITIENAEEPVKWNIYSPFQGGYLTPPDGTEVVFSPPDINKNCVIELIATDTNGNIGSIKISIIDEGNPPEPGEILINEIAWAGTLKSAYDEYIEILNITDRDFFLNNWKIENAGGNGVPITFSGYIKAKSPFLLTNYASGSEKTAIKVTANFTSPKIALSNSRFGPYILENSEGILFDTIGDGKSYPYGINSENTKASMARFIVEGVPSTSWDPNSWYTEGVSINLSDNTYGTPGRKNSNAVYGNNSNEEDASGLIIKYFIDAKDEIGEDWVEILITEDGNIKNFIITDLDGNDRSITNDENIYYKKGDVIVVIWGDDYSHINNYFTIPETNPTGTKDELVLLCSGSFLDGLCYYSTDNIQFDDEEKIKGYGWSGNPIHSKYGERKKNPENNYNTALNENAWEVSTKPVP